MCLGSEATERRKIIIKHVVSSFERIVRSLFIYSIVSTQIVIENNTLSHENVCSFVANPVILAARVVVSSLPASWLRF